MPTTINTSRAQKVIVDIYNYDELPLSLTYTDKTDPNSPLPIDLTNYKFEFILNNGPETLKTYLIDAGEMTNEFLNKEGDNNNILNMESMWEDMRNSLQNNYTYTLIQKVTDDSNQIYVHLVYTINARNY